MNISRRQAAGIIGLGMVSSLIRPKFAHAQNNSSIKPKALENGDKVALIAPGTNVTDPDDLQKAVSICKYYGLIPVISENTKSAGTKAISVDKRVKDLHNAFLDNEIKAVFCIRGGYGSAHLLDKINYDIVRKNPKIFVGYSDITALHIAIYQNAALATFHGPVMLSKFSEYSAEIFRKMLFGEDIEIIKNPDTVSGVLEQFPCRTIASGRASGKLVGGNLSLISSLMGTKYELDAKDKLLFIEDVGEAPYRIDRMLTQLKMSGKLDDCTGIIFARCNDCGGSANTWDLSLGEVLDRILGDLDKPVFYGLMFGHTDNQMTIPFGIEAEIDSEKCYIKLKEKAVI